MLFGMYLVCFLYVFPFLVAFFFFSVVGGLDIQVDGSIVEGEFYCYYAANSIISYRKAMFKKRISVKSRQRLMFVAELLGFSILSAYFQRTPQ